MNNAATMTPGATSSVRVATNGFDAARMDSRPVQRHATLELIAEIRGSDGYGPLVMHPLVGGMPVDEAWKSVRLLTDKVLPALA